MPEVRLVGNIVLRTMVSLWLGWCELPASNNARVGGVGVLNCLHLINCRQKEERKKSHSALRWPGSSPLANQCLTRMPLVLLYWLTPPLRSLASCLCREPSVPPPHEAGCRQHWKSPGLEKLIKFRPWAFQVTGTEGGKPHPLAQRTAT